MLVAEGAHADQALALAALVPTVYRRFRSHGGTHQPENLGPASRDAAKAFFDRWLMVLFPPVPAAQRANCRAA
jgi:hypothetical protein